MLRIAFKYQRDVLELFETYTYRREKSADVLYAEPQQRSLVDEEEVVDVVFSEGGLAGGALARPVLDVFVYALAAEGVEAAREHGSFLAVRADHALDLVPEAQDGGLVEFSVLLERVAALCGVCGLFALLLDEGLVV